MKKNNLRIDDEIYFIYGETSINKLTVKFLGNSSFVHNYAFDPQFKENFRRPIEYKDEGITWFRTFEQAKQKLYEKHESSGHIKQYDTDYWEIKL